jgi:hypothetical protein
VAAPTLQAQGNVAANTSGDLTITLPTYAANDIVVITTVGFVPNTATGANTQSLASPWTKNSPNVTVITGGLIDEEHACWWARATSNSSLGSTVTITRPANWDTGTDTCWGGRAYVIRGCVTTGNPFDDFASTALSTAANPVLPAFTVAGGNRLAIVFMTKADNTTNPTAATGYTVGTNATSTAGTDCSFQTYRQTTSANLGTVTPTGGSAPAANNGNSCYFEFAFIPAPVTATASAPLGNIGTTVTATVKKLASGSAALGGLTASATGTVITPAVTGVANAALGGLVASGSATVSHLGSADAPLGGLSASAIGTVTPVVSGVAEAPLGGVSSSGSATVKKVASGAAPLGGLSGSASATVTNAGSASATLGGLSASATGDVTVLGVASASLGAATSSAVGVVTVVATAQALLGGLDASAIGQASDQASASAALGGLTASAVGTVTPQPPVPPQPVEGGGRPYPYRRQKKVKKVEPVVEVVEVVREPATVVAYCNPVVAGVVAAAVGEITFSAEEDDLQVLLML